MAPGGTMCCGVPTQTPPMKPTPRIARLCLALSLAAASVWATAQASPPPAPLLTHAASDFRQHTQPLPDQFRRVRQGQFTAPDGRTRTVLCGEFKAGPRGPWTRFATVQTDPYEQWLGDGALGWCKAPVFKPGGPDLSAMLKRALGAPAAVSSAPAR